MAHYISKETGTVLTPAIIEALGAEAEKGYDLTKGTVVRVGRPALQEGGSASPRISVRMPRSLYDAAHARAKKEGRPVSELAREAMERYVKS